MDSFKFYLLKNKMGKMGKYMVKIKSYVRKGTYNFGYNFTIVKSFFLVRSYARIKATNIIVLLGKTTARIWSVLVISRIKISIRC